MGQVRQMMSHSVKDVLCELLKGNNEHWLYC